MMNNKCINGIIILTNTLAKGGAELQAIELANVLNEKYKIYLVVLDGKNKNSKLLKKIDTTISLVFFSGNKLKIVFELVQLIKTSHVDCIYSYLATSNVYAVLIGRIFGVRYLIMNFCSSHYLGFKLYIQRYLHNYLASCSIVNSFRGYDFLIKHGCRSDKLFVIPNIIEFHESINSEYEKHEIPCIITVARFVKVKDYDTALLAIKNICERYSYLKFRYIIIGYGVMENYIRNKVKTLNLTNYVTIIVDPDNIMNYLMNADVYLSTSLVEGTSNSILEAMNAALPIVATNVGDNDYLLSTGNGFLAKIKNHFEISDRLFILLNNSELRKEMGEKSKQFVLEKFDSTILKDKQFELLNQIINSHN